MDWFANLFSRKASAGEPAFSIAIENGVTVVTPLREPTVDEVTAMAESLAEDGRYIRRLYDFSGLPFPYSVEEIRQFADKGIRIMPERNRMAIVVRDEVGYGTMRAFSVYRSKDGIAQTLVSRSRDEAMAWLSEEF